MDDIKCNIKDCLCYEKKGRSGVCSDYVPPMIPKLKPNSKECPFYCTSIEEGLKWLRMGKMEAVKNKDKKIKKGKLTPFE